MSQALGVTRGALLRPQALAPLRQRGYRVLWLCSLFWNLARWIDVPVTGWIALELTDSAWLVALIGFYRSALVPVFGIFGGAIADRLDRRQLIIITQIGNTAVTVALAGLVLAGRLEYWHLAVANLVLGLSWALDWPTRRSLIADLVPRTQLLDAMVLDSVSMNITKVIGPALGGGLLALSGAEGAYLAVVVVNLASVAAILFLPAAGARPLVGPASMLRQVAEGLRYCWRTPVIFGVLAITVGMNMLVFPYIQVLPVFARDVLRVGPVGLGLLAAGDGIGSLVGAALLLSAGRVRREGRLFTWGTFLMVVALGLFALSREYYLAVGLLILFGLAHSTFSALQSVIILSVAKAEVRGRAMGALALAIGSTPVGMLQIGLVAQGFGASAAVLASAVVGASVVLLVALLVPELRRHPPGG